MYQDEQCYAFADISPQAPTHILIVPRVHIASLAHTGPEDKAMLGHLMAVAAEIAREKQLGTGYRVVANTGSDGGQTGGHLHLHLLGGRGLGWPPG